MRKAVAALALSVLAVAGCSPSKGVHAHPVAVPPPSPTTTTTPPANGPITYTVEPFDFDQTSGITMTVTQDQFGGTKCPCMKIAYPADGNHNQQGADAIDQAVAHMKSGDTLMGFSLGVQVISLYLSETGLAGHHPLPAGVHVLLAGDTWNRNNILLATAPDSAHTGATGQGIPTGITNDVTMVVNEYDGWSDAPDKTNDPNYNVANQNAVAGTQSLHYYANADVNNSANVVVQYGNIKTILVPTQHLPQNNWLRHMGADASVDALDVTQRAQINTAYTRTGSTAAQQAAAGAEQVPVPNPAWQQKPEPVLALP